LRRESPCPFHAKATLVITIPHHHVMCTQAIESEGTGNVTVQSWNVHCPHFTRSQSHHGPQVPGLCSSLTPLQIRAGLSYSLHATPPTEILPESFGEKRSLARCWECCLPFCCPSLCICCLNWEPSVESVILPLTSK
jgi:hypothetical protein